MLASFWYCAVKGGSVDIMKTCEAVKAIASHASSAPQGVVGVRITKTNEKTMEGSVVSVTFCPFGHITGAGMGKVSINKPPWEVRWEDISDVVVTSAILTR